MASNLLSNASGHPDLDTVFAPYSTGTSPAATGLLVGGVDIATRYAPLVLGTQAPATGFLTQQSGHADINTLFAAYGSVQNVLSNPGYSALYNVASGASGSSLYTATTSIVLNSNGTWSEDTTQTPASGIWYSGAPINGIGGTYYVLYAVTASDSMAGVTITNSAKTVTSLSTDVSCVISLSYGAGGTSSRTWLGSLNIQISNAAGTVLSNQTVGISLTVNIS